MTLRRIQESRVVIRASYGEPGMKIFNYSLIIVLMLHAPLLSADFLTAEPPAITLDPGVPVGSSVLAIINSGESLGGFTFQGAPDGIGLAPGPGPNSVDVFVSHEETTVPFFGRADFQDASISRVTLNTLSGGVMEASVALPASAGFLRFCSAFMGSPAEGYSSYIYFTGEEANDIVPVPAGAPYGPDPALAPLRQAGYAVVLDTHTGEYTQLAGAGRFNHENTVTVPGGWRGFTLLSTDDTFNAPSAQLYMYRSKYEPQVWPDRSLLLAFQVTHTDDGPVDPADPFNNANDYLDIQPGDDWQGRFIRVPVDIARGETAVAPQQALEDWSNENNVFQFIRLEDLAYDRNDPRIVYASDTGRSRIVPDPATGRMQRGPGGTVGRADNGRIFRFVFNRRNPQKVDSFSVFADGDAPATPAYVAMTSPDNMDTGMHSLMVQEDTSDGKIWHYEFATGAWKVVASVNDPSGESTGIVDASEWFGSGSWILNVQSGRDVFSAFDPVSGVTSKLSYGQLLLMTIPGT
jgi:hypothetical protein